MDDFVRESIDLSVGLPVSTSTLELKLRTSEESRFKIRDQYLDLLSKFNAKDDLIQRLRAESSMNAQAVKKFVEENQKLATDCSNLLAQSKKWERECLLYERDREALMEFGNEAYEHARESEIRVRVLEAELRRLEEELRFYKRQCEMPMVDASSEATSEERKLVKSMLKILIGKDVVASKSRALLEANTELEVCQRLLNMWNSLTPSTHNVLAVLAEVKSLHTDKEHLRINLHRAEEEVKVLFEENNILDEENKKLKKVLKEGLLSDSAGKHSSSGSTKGNKRKSSPTMSGPISKKIDQSDFESTRLPLSPLQTANVVPHHSSPECP